MQARRARLRYPPELKRRRPHTDRCPCVRKGSRCGAARSIRSRIGRPGTFTAPAKRLRDRRRRPHAEQRHHEGFVPATEEPSSMRASRDAVTGSPAALQGVSNVLQDS